MYYLSPNYLYVSTSYTSLTITVTSDVVSVTQIVSNNRRNLNILVPTGSIYSALTGIAGITVISGSTSIVTENVILRGFSTVINGIQYYFSSLVNSFSLVISDQITEGQYLIGDALNIVINSTHLTDNLSSYLVKITSSYLYTSTINSGLWTISNICSIYLNRNNSLSINDTLVYVDTEYSITSVDITAAFAQYLKNSTNFNVIAELNDKTNLSDKTLGYLVYTSSLATPFGEHTTHLKTRSDLGRYIRVSIPVTLEYLTDNLMNWNKLREDRLYDLGMFLNRVFTLTDPTNVNWNCTIDWKPIVSTNFSGSPTSKHFSDTTLYSLPLECNLIGYLVERITPYTRILTIIRNFIVENNSITLSQLIQENTFTVYNGVISDPKIITSNYTASVNDNLTVNTNNGSITILLPLSPNINDIVLIQDLNSSWSTHNLLISGNGNNISNSSNLNCNVSKLITFLFTENGWKPEIFNIT